MYRSEDIVVDVSESISSDSNVRSERSLVKLRQRSAISGETPSGVQSLVNSNVRSYSKFTM